MKQSIIARIKKLIAYSIYCIVLVTLISSCASPQSRNLMQKNGPRYTSKPFQDYRLKQFDEIIVTILTSNTDISVAFNGIVTNTVGGQGSTYTIYESGNISIPFFGEINISGLTIPEAEETIEKAMRLAVPDAQVKIFLKNNQFYVVSEGGQKGMFPVFKENMTIYQALGSIGVPDGRILDVGKVKILRTDLDGKTSIKEFDLRSESIIESEFYYIKPNDTIYLSTSIKSFYRIESFQQVLTTITAPLSFIMMLLAFRVKF